MALRIGFATQFYTLWEVSSPYRHYVSQYAWEMRADYFYIRNLSKDKDLAISKAKKAGVTDLEPDHELYGRSGVNFTKSLDQRGTDLKDYHYPGGISRRASEGTDIRFMGDTEQTVENDVKALWSLYLKKEIVFDKENPVREEWRRPIAYARRRLADLGVIIKYNGEWMTPNVAEMRKERARLEAEKNATEGGHHFESGDKVELEITVIDEFGFQGMYGWCDIITYKDSNNKLFYYMGGSAPEIKGTVKVKATIKHTEYKGDPQTHLQRIKIL